MSLIVSLLSSSSGQFKSNTTATTAPSANDDVSQGYVPGSLWIDTLSNTLYFCIDNSLSNAVWQTQVSSPLNFVGNWDANNNIPTLTSGVGTQGSLYYVSVAGNTNLDGITDWKVGDFAAFNGTQYVKFDNTEPVITPVFDTLTKSAPSQTVYTLSQTPRDLNDFIVYLNGRVYSSVASDFTVVGTTLTWLNTVIDSFPVSTEFYAKYNANI